MEHLIQSRSLAGSWEFRLDGEREWRAIAVPGCWEAIGVHTLLAGPGWYRTRLRIPADWAGRRIRLAFDGVSYHCELFIDGQSIGEHTGIWDAFAFDISDAVRPGVASELLLRVEKPAGLERGPSSASLPGRFPLRETLSGFLPYVWGHIFGGIWQDVWLLSSGATVFGDVYASGTAEGLVRVTAELSGAGAVTLTIVDPDGQTVYEQTKDAEQLARFELHIAAPQLWSPDRPALYSAQLQTPDGDLRSVRFGMRSLEVDGATIRLNGAPLYVRMVLSWGWYADVQHSNPGPERVRADLERLKSLGYNGVKLCLWFPPQYYFDLADELGMLLWVELPMWLPNPTAFFRQQLALEYDRLVRQARSHPAVILYSLGCELNRAVGADILGPLFEHVKELAGDALVRDNSGSGETYGGLLNEHAEYYDYHFYSDLQFYRGLIDYFSPRGRPEMPWLFGEFCDVDSFRDLRRLIAPAPARPPETLARRLVSALLPHADERPQQPWWTLADAERNPQGARWQYDVVHHEDRLRAIGMWERGAELELLSERQALIYRKHVLELMRTYREIGGYVLTGERDTPISTAGMWDDQDRLKCDPAEFRAFNADLVALLGWDRRRTWAGGGDRAARWDTFCYSSGALVRPHLIASSYGARAAHAQISWEVGFDGEPPLASGTGRSAAPVRPGGLCEVLVAEWIVPELSAPRRATLSVHLELGEQRASNSWPLWFFPRGAWAGLEGLALIDPAGRLGDLRQLCPQLQGAEHAGRAGVVIAGTWSPELAELVARGGRAILLQAGASVPGPLPVVEMPFWREAIRIAEAHPAWGDFPYEDIGMQFYGCATDYALDTSATMCQPILSRLDARTMRLHSYAAELSWGNGRAIVSTLRLEGGAGDQPLGISRSPAAAYLLQCWVRALLRD